jgi:Domain of unknown function (DUF1830)
VRVWRLILIKNFSKIMLQQSISRSSNNAEIILCCYINYTNHIQVIRISNTEGWYFERVVFSGQRLLFEAPSHAQLEVYEGAIISAMLVDRITCQNLQVDTQNSTAKVEAVC